MTTTNQQPALSARQLTIVALQQIWGDNWQRSCGEKPLAMIQSRMADIITTYETDIQQLYKTNVDLKPLPVLRHLLRLHDLKLIRREIYIAGLKTKVYRLAQIKD